MSYKKLLLGFAAVVLLLTTSYEISSFMLLVLCAIMAMLVAMAAIAAIKATAVAEKSNYNWKLKYKRKK